MKQNLKGNDERSLNCQFLDMMDRWLWYCLVVKRSKRLLLFYRSPVILPKTYIKFLLKNGRYAFTDDSVKMPCNPMSVTKKVAAGKYLKDTVENFFFFLVVYWIGVLARTCNCSWSFNRCSEHRRNFGQENIASHSSASFKAVNEGGTGKVLEVCVCVCGCMWMYVGVCGCICMCVCMFINFF